MRSVVAAIACTGCSSILGIDDFKLSDASTTTDSSIDAAPIDAPPNCLGADRFIVCLNPLPTAEVMFSSAAMAQVNTDTDARCLAQQPMGWTSTQGQPAACFIAGTRITIANLLTATGTRPLVLVATDSITVGMPGIVAGIDVAGRRGQAVRPAGAPFPMCMPPSQAENGGTFDCGAGGAGGTFLTVGGRGGPTANRQAGLPSLPVAAPATLRAGCNGGVGGSGPGGGNAIAGNGGGAVYVVAGARIDIAAPINASGSGAFGGSGCGGGAGAGSGGMIVLYAPAINGMQGGTLVANGGGGGGGGDVGGAGGNPGADPNPSSPTQFAVGGTGPSPGGQGFPSMARDGIDGGGQRAGGGGGGGGGYIRSNRAITIPASPPVSVVP